MEAPRSGTTRAAREEVGTHTTVDLGVSQALPHVGAGALLLHLGEANEGLTGAVDERVDALRRDVEDVGGLDRRHAEPLAQHHRLALLLGQRRQEGHGDVELVVRLHLLGDRGARIGMPLAELLVDATPLGRGDAREALVAEDAEQPGTRLADTLALSEHAMGRQKRGLHGVLSILQPAETVPGETQQLTRVLLIKGSRQRALIARAGPTRAGNGDGHDASVDAWRGEI